MNKRVCLTLLSTAAPYEVKIMGQSGRFFTRTVRSKISTLCFYTMGCQVRIRGMHGEMMIVKRYTLNCCKRQSITVGFNFSSIEPRMTPQSFTLVDNTYDLPIRDAILTFKNQ